MKHELRVALCHSITARAHLAGAEAAEMEAQAQQLFAVAAAVPRPVEDWQKIRSLDRQALAARRRYWREVSAAARLSGMPWPEAEALGVEPPATVSTSQEA